MYSGWTTIERTSDHTVMLSEGKMTMKIKTKSLRHYFH